MQGHGQNSCWEIWGSNQADWASFTLWKSDISEQGREMVATELRNMTLLATRE